METRGLVTREQFNEIPPHAEYQLTDLGNKLLPIFFELSRWGTLLDGTGVTDLDADRSAETAASR